jgi:hypothetical protein
MKFSNFFLGDKQAVTLQSVSLALTDEMMTDLLGMRKVLSIPNPRKCPRMFFFFMANIT